jgi:general stress protein 26
MAQRVTLDDIRGDVTRIVGDVAYATMTTVDPAGRPRARVLIVVWEFEHDDPVGWLGTYRTPVKAAHIAANPHVTTSYWSPRQDVAAIDSVARWVSDPEVADRVWSLYRDGSPKGCGYDPGRFWSGPDDPQFHVMRLDPWRIQVLNAADLAAGRPYRQWRQPSPASDTR